MLLDLSGLRKAAQLVLREDSLAVDIDVEDAAGTTNEFRLDVEFLLERRGQTGRAGKVVSGHTPGNRCLHWFIFSYSAHDTVARGGDQPEQASAGTRCPVPLRAPTPNPRLLSCGVCAHRRYEG